MALLNEMEEVTGRVETKGRVFYVSQEPWIFPSSLRQNILFGKKYERQKFKLVLKLSCLDKDVALMPHRESTIIGEKGINLSGGQRARVSMARALYSDADIYVCNFLGILHYHIVYIFICCCTLTHSRVVFKAIRRST